MATTTHTSIEIVRSFLAAMAVKDYETGLRYISADCDYENVPLGRVQGPSGVRGVLEPFFAPTIENEFQVKRAVADGPVVFMERLDRHLLDTGWVELPVAGVWEVHDGLITVWHDYFDAATILSKWPAPVS